MGFKSYSRVCPCSSQVYSLSCFQRGINYYVLFVRHHCVSSSKGVDAGNSKVAPRSNILIFIDLLQKNLYMKAEGTIDIENIIGNLSLCCVHG